MKILLLPLFTFPTGHSKVSNTMGEWIKRAYPEAKVVETDILSYSQPTIEKFVATFYLKWIQFSPKSYGYIYRALMGKQKGKQNQAYFGKVITAYFEKRLLQLIKTEEPDMIFCTHSFASKIAVNVKRKNHLGIPIINVYTDLFINGVWNVRGADYHFVPTKEAEQEITTMFGVEEDSVFVTGIPIHPDFTERQIRRANNRAHVLIAGGNTGLMDVEHLNHLIRHYPALEFTILCGKNKKLYDDLQQMKSSKVHVRSYIDSVKEMNALYDTVDAIISKPGGVTISEVIHKEIPLYISHYLPGPEEMNVEYLLAHGMGRSVTMEDLAKTAETDFCRPEVLKKMITQMRYYHKTCSISIPEAIDVMMKEERVKQYRRVSLSKSYERHASKRLSS